MAIQFWRSALSTHTYAPNHSDNIYFGWFCLNKRFDKFLFAVRSSTHVFLNRKCKQRSGGGRTDSDGFFHYSPSHWIHEFFLQPNVCEWSEKSEKCTAACARVCVCALSFVYRGKMDFNYFSFRETAWNLSRLNMWKRVSLLCWCCCLIMLCLIKFVDAIIMFTSLPATAADVQLAARWTSERVSVS